MTVLSPVPSPRVVPGQSWSVRPPPVTVTTLGLCFPPPRGPPKELTPRDAGTLKGAEQAPSNPALM